MRERRMRRQDNEGGEMEGTGDVEENEGEQNEEE